MALAFVLPPQHAPGNIDVHNRFVALSSLSEWIPGALRTVNTYMYAADAPVTT